MHYIIIGNGVAGMSAAHEIRNRDSGAEITIVSSESDHFFSRTALMYLFSGQLSAKDIEPYERDHYERMKFTRVRGRVVGLDSASQTLRLQGGNHLKYDRLLIACGSVSKMFDWPGQELDGVGNFVTWQDLEWLQEKAGRARRAVVVGGGLIGIETAEILLHAGLEVTFLIREECYWPVALSPVESRLVVKHMRSHGCDVKLSTEVREVLGRSGKVIGIRTKDSETIDCELVVFTVGVRPQTDWLSGSHIELDDSGGIVVDDHLQTNLPHVWAAGDCCSVRWFDDIRRPEQLWYTSRDQGGVAGRNLVGDKHIYRRGTFYNSAKFFDIEYTTAGLVNSNVPGEADWFNREDDLLSTQRITFMKDSQLVIGFNMLGRRWDHSLLVKWIEQKRTLTWVTEHLHEATFDEEFTPKFKIDKTVKPELV